ncbi:MAG: TonB-dependent receptor, partial [Gammaproteobacteria bacterium]|nr:TonB-dependent receptor [Gammaproteobacteria bacterium]
KPADNRSWLFDAHYLEQPETPRVDELVPGFGQSEPSSSEFFFAPNRRIFVHGRYTVTDGLAGLDWNADVAWQRIDDDRVSRDFEATDRRRESNSSDLYGLTLSASRLTDSGSWIVGAELYHDEVSSQRLEDDLLTGASQTLASRFPDGSEVRQAALYGNVQRQVADRHNLSFGVRVSNDDVTLPATAVSGAADIDSTDVSGDLGWIFDVTDRWHLLANVGLGFRAPNVFDLGTLGNRPGNRFNVPNTTLDSERVTQADLGIRYRTDRMRFDLMVYALRYDDRITSVGTGDVTPDGRDIVQSVNAAESSIRGVEAGVDVRISDALSARAVLNYSWGEQEVTGSDAEPADRIPPLNGNVMLTYDSGGDYRLESWVRFADAQDRLSTRDVRDSRSDPQGTPGWAVIGAKLEKAYAQRWLLSVAVDNLLDKRYRVHGSGLDAPGLNLMISARYTW